MASERGYSLPELLISVVLIGISIFTITTLFSHGLLSARNLDTASEVSNLVEEVRLGLGTRDRCTVNLAGSKVSIGSPAGEPILTRNWKSKETAVALAYYDASRSPLSPIVEVGKLSGKITVTEIRIVPKAQTDSNRLVGELVLTFDKGKVLGPEVVVRHLPIDIETSAGELVSCSLTPDNDAMLVTELVCSVSSQGQNKIDPVTGACVPRDSSWIAGNSDEARCPAGSRIPPADNTWANCRAIPPQGYVDTSERYKRTFKHKGPITSALPQALTTIDPTSQTCLCDYASDIDSSTWTCQIRCEPWGQ